MVYENIMGGGAFLSLYVSSLDHSANPAAFDRTASTREDLPLPDSRARSYNGMSRGNPQENGGYLASP